LNFIKPKREPAQKKPGFDPGFPLDPKTHLLAAKPAPDGLLDPRAAPIGLGSLAALTGGIATFNCP
jgi:hypothetical protein